MISKKKKKKKRSLLKVRPVFHPNSLKFPAKSLMPNLQRGGPCLNFAHFTMQFCNPSDSKGGPWPNGPPLNTPLGGHKNLGRGTLTQPRPDEFGMRQRSGKYFAPNPVLSFFAMDFSSNLEVKTKKIKKVFIAKFKTT